MKTTDDKVKELFLLVQSKKLEIEKAEKPCWETSCNFGYSASSAHDRVDVRTVTDVRKLVDMYSFLLDRKEKSEKAAEELGVKYEFTWLGFKNEEWKNDFLTRISQITIQEKRKELSTVEARLNSIISPELKAQMELEEITKILNETK